MIKIENITKNYHNFSISSLNFKVEKGEFLSILGRSGSGKTTLLNIISGQEKNYSGIVTIQNDTIETSIKQGKISMVFQDSLLLPHLTIFENIVFGLRLRKIPKDEIEIRGQKILSLMELDSLRESFPSQLSGGQKQRVGIGRALATEPSLLLMDEPFSALDGELREKLQKLMKELQKTLGLTIIFVTHDKKEAFFLSDKIIIIDEGKIIREGTPLEIYSQPLTLNVANFLGMENIIPITQSTSLFQENKKNIPIFTKEQLNTSTFIIIPREKLEIINTTNPNTVDTIQIKGIVKEYIFNLGYHFIKIDVLGIVLNVKQNRLPYPIFLEKEVFIEYRSEDIILVTQ